MGKKDRALSGAQRAIQTLEMLQISVHHERCQTALEAAAALIAEMVGDEEAFAAMLRIHQAHFPEATAEQFREGMEALSPVIMHVAQVHEIGSRNSVLHEAGLGAAIIEFQVPPEVFETAENLMPTLFDDPDVTPESMLEVPNG